MKINLPLGGALGTLALLGTIQQGRADVSLFPLFANDMVLQRDKAVPVWGTASPGEKITVQVGKQTAKTAADGDGNWLVTLKAAPAANNVSFKVTGNNSIELQNVAIGDVYICSGQSNMEFRVQEGKDHDAEIAAANFPGVRHLDVPNMVEGELKKVFGGPVQWQVANPQNVANFSAVAYFFGRELNQKLGIPIGLINASWGGTIAQTWISRDTLLKRDDLKGQTRDMEAEFASASGEAGKARQMEWLQKVDPGTKGKWNAANLDDAAWKTMKLPDKWEVAGLPDYDGLVWFRKSIVIPANWAGKDLEIHLGSIDDLDETFFNGASIGQTNGFLFPRTYTIPGNQVKAGRANIAIRILDTGGDGGPWGGDSMRLEVKGDPAQKIDLSGDWRYQASADIDAIKPIPAMLTTLRSDPNHPTLLYNGMISPLLPFAVKGAIWYQGESNAENPTQYRTLFPDLIKDWRQHWGAKADGSDFPFYFVQLASYMDRSNEPVQSGWAELRDAQSNTLNVVPHTGMASAIDIGEGNDIHPKNKQDVGKRLALNALALTYGQKVEYTGPTYKGMKAVGNTVRIDFTHADGLKTGDGTAPRTFALQGDDGKWVTANAKIEGNSVILSNDAVATPKAVRYGWANNPNVNLFNSVGLPANPFRTDAP